MIISFGLGGGSDHRRPHTGEAWPAGGGRTSPRRRRHARQKPIANSPKDGYTLEIMTAGQIIAPVITKAPRYDILKAFDLAGQIATTGLDIITRPDYPA